ncbi:hypothetical protein ACTWPT_41825 [Nonomuraea sp. 3N208]|uniref:hypothetical protein n=1 Tax=Nonomuraea sp. 3N208 TaxID=3457421 RepID=UPI003FD5E6F3
MNASAAASRTTTASAVGSRVVDAPIRLSRSPVVSAAERGVAIVSAVERGVAIASAPGRAAVRASVFRDGASAARVRAGVVSVDGRGAVVAAGDEL